MPRARRKPFDPSKPIPHDRRTTDLLRNARVAPIEIDDPLEIGGKLIVMRSTRDDPLADHHARGHIDEAQYHAGRAFQRDFEATEKGARAIEWKEAVDGGGFSDPLTDSHLRASESLKKAYRALGSDGSALIHDVLIHNRTMKQVQASRGFSGERWERYFGTRFGECLDCLARVYGFAMK